jgi:hypothetical protein
MRSLAALALLSLSPGYCLAGNKLNFDDKVELTRGLMAEYAKTKVLLPRSRSALDYDAATGIDRSQWSKIAQENGPAARTGQKVQITKVEIGAEKIVLELNGGYNGGRKWYRNVQVGAGPSQMPDMTRVGDDVDDNAPYGTSIAILFHKPLESMKTADVKKLLAPILDFDLHSVTEIYAENLSPELQSAIKSKRAVVGMNREQVILALGEPLHKERSTKDGVELEDWVYGEAPGKFTFITFKGDKAIAVKEEYAGLGTQVNDPAPPVK